METGVARWDGTGGVDPSGGCRCRVADVEANGEKDANEQPLLDPCFFCSVKTKLEFVAFLEILAKVLEELSSRLLRTRI